MSERLTPDWVSTLDEAYGERGTKGRLGEEFAAEAFRSWGWEVRRYEDDRQKQVDGIDMEFKKPEWANFYSCDIKNNMDKYGNFFVHKSWLLKIKSDRVFHVNHETRWMVWYPVDEMRKAYDNNLDYMKFTAKTRLPFMRATHVK